MLQLANPQCIPLQSGIIYGPIRSRRLGNSLGINPLPTSYKLCSSNCVYCQYGWTTNENPTGEQLPALKEILAAAEASFAQARASGERMDWITLAGNGEPTLHPQLEAMVEELRRLRGTYLPAAKLGILSDSTTVHRAPVRRALEALDERFMKLDVGTPEAFARINQPMGRVDWERMIDGLSTLKEPTLQSMFIAGTVDNTRPEEVEAWIAVVARIRPKAVQVYTIDRPPADSGLRQVTPARLQEIGRLCAARTHIPVQVYQ